MVVRGHTRTGVHCLMRNAGTVTMLLLRPPVPQDVENIAALPVEAAEAEQMLHDNANLLQVGNGGVGVTAALGACTVHTGCSPAAALHRGRCTRCLPAWRGRA